MFTGPQGSVEAYPSEPSFSQFRSRQGSRLHAVLHQAVLRLDRILRRTLGIFEFSANPCCLLRIAIVRVRPKLLSPLGTCAERTDAVIELHFWNEHVARSLAGTASCARAKAICRDLQLSLELLAEYLSAHPEIKARVLHARMVMPIGNRFPTFKAIAEKYGFTVTTSPLRGLAVIHDFFEDFLVHALAWAFNPRRAPRKRRTLERADLRIDRDEFLDRYLCSRTKDGYRETPWRSANSRREQLCETNESVKRRRS